MKNKAILSAVVCIAALIFTLPIEARGGGGGGGGGRGGGGGSARSGGGAARSSGAINRSPSMSRSVSKASVASKPTRAQVNNRIQQTPRNVSNIARSANKVNNQQLSSIIQNRTQSDVSRNNVSNNVRNEVAQRYPGRNDWFSNDFMQRHDYTPNYDLGNGNAWKYASWGALASWNNWGWSEPYYYDYGTDTNTSYAYADQVQEITSAPVQSNQNAEWLSLGVFSVSKENAADFTPNFYMQLALDKNGNIDGTLYNTTTDKAYPLEGLVDKETQRAAWMMSNSQNAPIIETGIYNLTKDQAQAKVTFADGSTKNILLVRLKQ